MELKNNLLTTLGLCRRAGKLLIGAENTEHSARNGKSRLVIVANDVSAPTREKFRRLMSENEKTVYLFPPVSMTELAAAVGIHGILGVVSTEDEGFAKLISSKFDNEATNGGHE